jgi:hypothetical protein
MDHPCGQRHIAEPQQQTKFQLRDVIQWVTQPMVRKLVRGQNPAYCKQISRCEENPQCRTSYVDQRAESIVRFCHKSRKTRPHSKFRDDNPVLSSWQRNRLEFHQRAVRPCRKVFATESANQACTVCITGLRHQSIFLQQRRCLTIHLVPRIRKPAERHRHGNDAPPPAEGSLCGGTRASRSHHGWIPH